MEHPGHARSRNDPYRVLGVDTSASRREIGRAYRRAVHGAHPDTQPDDPMATARFAALTDAYDLLSDPRRRADYDRQHPAERPDRSARQRGSSHPIWVPHGNPVWAGPVHIEPTAAQAPRQDGASPPAADFEDPPVVLGRQAGCQWGWPW